MIDKDRLYNGAVCKLCGMRRPEHHDECPGRVIDVMQYAVKFTASGGHGDDHATWSGMRTADTLAGAIESAAGAVHEADVWTVEPLMVAPIAVTIVPEMRVAVRRVVEAVALRQRAERDEEEAEHRSTQWELAYNDLVAQRDDLTPAAYERRLAALGPRPGSSS